MAQDTDNVSFAQAKATQHIRIQVRKHGFINVVPLKRRGIARAFVHVNTCIEEEIEPVDVLPLLEL